MDYFAELSSIFIHVLTSQLLEGACLFLTWDPLTNTPSLHQCQLHPELNNLKLQKLSCGGIKTSYNRGTISKHRCSKRNKIGFLVKQLLRLTNVNVSP